MRSIRIVLGDDHSLIREGTRKILEQHPNMTVVGEAGDGEEVLELISRLRPDIAILDIRMPKLNGIETVRQMAASSPNTRALMLTAYDDDEYILALMGAGASGYLMKTARAAELLDAVEKVSEGGSVLDPTIAAKVARLWGSFRNQDKHQVEQRRPETLTSRETEVLTFAAMGMRNKAIADRLVISVRTVEGHLNAILTKLGLSTRTEAALYAVSAGLVQIHDKDQPGDKEPL